MIVFFTAYKNVENKQDSLPFPQDTGQELLDTQSIDNLNDTI